MAKNSNFILAIFFITAGFHSIQIFGVGEARQIKALYGELLRIQGLNSPYQAVGEFKCGHEGEINSKTYTKAAADAFYKTQPQFKKMFEDAGQTGLIVQYRQLILSENPAFSMAFCDKLHLQVIAYMQNLYGKGQPFVYDAMRKPNLLIGGVQYDSAMIGSYMNPQKQILTMTRYGILNGVIDQLVALEQDQSVALNKNFQYFCSQLLINLTEAIKLSCLEALQTKLKCSHALDQRFISKINPLVDAINKIKDLLP